MICLFVAQSFDFFTAGGITPEATRAVPAAGAGATPDAGGVSGEAGLPDIILKVGQICNSINMYFSFSEPLPSQNLLFTILLS